jgi:hypothetical protein
MLISQPPGVRLRTVGWRRLFEDEDDDEDEDEDDFSTHNRFP